MAEISTIARPYAQAAFDVAKADNALSSWESFLGDAAHLAQNSKIRELANNPRVTSEQILSVFEAALMSTQAGTKNFLAALISQGRVDALPAVYQAFVEHRHSHEGSADAHIVSAFAMSDKEVSDITAALEKKLNVKLNPTVSVDESLIGGFTATVGDEVLDMSVRAKLARMQVALTA